MVLISGENKIWEDCISVLEGEVNLENTESNAERVQSAWLNLCRVFYKQTAIPEKWSRLVSQFFLLKYILLDVFRTTLTTLVRCRPLTTPTRYCPRLSEMPFSHRTTFPDACTPPLLSAIVGE